VVGAGRAGTTSIWRYLDGHPEIFMSRLKEPHFFSRGGIPISQNVRDGREYLELFAPGSEAAYRGEATAGYLWDENAAPAIKRAYPDARIVISLRDPVERAYSNYWLTVQLGFEQRTFRAAVEAELEEAPDLDSVPPPYLARGLYAEQVARYLGAFEHVHVMFFEDLVADPVEALRGIFRFLEVDTAPADEIDTTAHNAFRAGSNPAARRFVDFIRRNGLARFVPHQLKVPLGHALTSPQEKLPLDAETAAVLRAFFVEPDARLRALLRRPLGWDT
jgi:Sulfotransferase family